VEQKRAPESYAGLTSIFPCPKRGVTWTEEEKPMLFQTWSPKKLENLVSWYYSVKLNGAFARWQDGQLYTKSGRLLHPPPRITQHLPRDIAFDGEIYAGLDGMPLVRKALSDVWEKNVKLVIFDLVELKTPFVERWRKLQDLQKQYHFSLAPQHLVKSEKDYIHLLQKFQDSPEEGLVFRHPQSFYQPGVRSKNTLKWKPKRSGQGRILTMTPRKTGVLLRVSEKDTDIPFSLYITQKQMRTHPVKVGDNISFLYTGRDEKDQPEFARMDK
jgi:ATP-dependent DNA ligase